MQTLVLLVGLSYPTQIAAEPVSGLDLVYPLASACELWQNCLFDHVLASVIGPVKEVGLEVREPFISRVRRALNLHREIQLLESLVDIIRHS